jgi:predicted acyl esterase
MKLHLNLRKVKLPMLGVILLLLTAKNMPAQIKLMFDTRIPMSDGVELSADIWLPDKEGKCPAILICTPYHKTEILQHAHYEKFFTSHGYVFIIQDCRGRGDSDGEFNFVFPDGSAVNLGSRFVGVLRARYRNGRNREDLLTPNKTEKFNIELFNFGHTFLPGHRIRIEISSSAFPYINPNQNTGNPVATDTEWMVAHQTIYHDSRWPSHIVLPVMPRDK